MYICFVSSSLENLMFCHYFPIPISTISKLWDFLKFWLPNFPKRRHPDKRVFRILENRVEDNGNAIYIKKGNIWQTRQTMGGRVLLRHWKRAGIPSTIINSVRNCPLTECLIDKVSSILCQELDENIFRRGFCNWM